MIRFIYILVLLLSFSCSSTPTKKVDDEVEKSTSTKKSEIEILNEAIMAQPNNYLVYLNRANFFIDNYQLEDAREDANRALKLNPNNAEVSYTKGVILFQTGQLDGAIPFFEHAIELDSNHARAYLKLAYINLAIPDFDKSIKQINKALKINKYIAEGYYMKGMWYEKQNKDALASSSYQTAIEMNQGYYDAYLAQGMLNDRLNRPLATQYFKNAIDLRPNSIEAWRLLAISYKDHQQYEEAIACFDTIISIDSTFEVAYFDKGATLLKLCYDSNPKQKNDSLLREALGLFNEAIALNTNYVPARYNRGLCYEELGMKQEARKEYQYVLKIEPNYDLAVKGMNRL